ncbi:DEAD/DEAH box helicase family protein [Paraclostridium bifermentans]|uniref:DEAD/DEAH box helicase family protein n=1 Tax=Paraclostridium bifermentans TaxID=1490 RepID=UPI001A9B2BA7|nr:DEAD/DEAH box helicase family protein [Paraclostridium bifermentans]
MNLNCITGNNDHLYKHIKQSFYKAKSIDIIVSFLMESGVKLLRKDLEEISNKNIPIRILTGNYLNITQPSALYLIKDILGDNVDLRFYNDTKRSFHPKAYIFEYEDGGEIFIGSSNLSKSALTEGIEWNYRIDQHKNIDDYKYFKGMFEDLFYNESIIVNDQELERYSKTWKRPKVYSNIGVDEFKKDIKEENNVMSIFEPRGAQIEALYELRKTREAGNDKGLVVAATGIGKTYLAAFDSREFNRVLFIAHREEILKQAYETFKTIRIDKRIDKNIVLVDNNIESYDYLQNKKEIPLKVSENIEIEDYKIFEEEFNMGFFMNSQRDTNKDIIFASVQSLGKESYLNENYFARDYFDYIVVDEFHHAVSNNYQNIINYFEPKFMLGLTATPERLDNKDVFSVCDYNTVYEATLKTAIDKGWLVPFRYYGIYDESVNYDEVEYKNGKYNTKELQEALSINKRADLIFNHYKKYKSSRALGFCTSKSHAEFMAKYFNEQGIPSCAVYSGSEGEYNEDRNIALNKLRDEKLKVIFSVDMFNEGLDVKSIDMVVFLRPTESPTIFLQQLGRGLRKDKNKKYLNVLDFIGNYKKANLVPYLLIGENKVNASSNRNMPSEEDFPEDCFIDFDFRLVDIFERMRKENQKVKDKITEEYFRIKLYVGHRPSRLDIFTYAEDEIYINIKGKNDIFKDYLVYLQEIGEITDAEKVLKDSFAGEFLNMVATTGMQKFYKIPILSAFYNNGNVKAKVSDSDLNESFISFYKSGTNKYFIMKDKDIKDEKAIYTDKFINNAKKNPIDAFLKTSSEYFYMEEDMFCLDNRMLEFLDNDIFIKEFKDCIDYRLKKFYKDKFEK